MNNEFSQRMSELLSLSKEEACRLRSKSINPEHLLLGIMREESSNATVILNTLNANVTEIKECIERRSAVPGYAELPYSENVELSLSAARILRFSTLEARAFKTIADTEHILLGILKEGNNLAADILEANDITYSRVIEAIKSVKPDVNDGFGFAEQDDEEDDAPQKPEKNSSQTFTGTRQAKPTNDTPVLDNFGMDMTKAAAEGRLDPVVGREQEIERISQILSRRKKNNPSPPMRALMAH